MAGDGVKTQHPLKSKTLWAALAIGIVGGIKPELVASLGPMGPIGMALVMAALRAVTDKPLGKGE